MLGKLAYRNAKRSVKDYLIYLITITISFSLILAFHLVAGAEEVVKLSEGMNSFQKVLTFVNAVIVIVVCFLIQYTTKFMFEKRSKEFGTYMLLGIKKKDIAKLVVEENTLLGTISLIFAIPLGFLFSQFVSLVIVRMLDIPKVIFISLNFASVGRLFIYFAVIYLLVLLHLLKSIRKMTVHDFLYFDKQNEKKMFHSGKKRNVVFVFCMVTGIFSLVFMHSRFHLEKISELSTMSELFIAFLFLIVSIYGLCATCADMLLSLLLKNKKLKYQKDYLFVARTFASKIRTMSFTFGTLSVLILLSLLCLNFSAINKGVYRTSIEMNAPYDVDICDWKYPFEDFNEYKNTIEEDYTIQESIVYTVYKEKNHQIQNFYDVQFYKEDPVIKLSDYNRLRKLRNMESIKLKEDEYFLVTSAQSLYKVKDNDAIQKINVSNRELKLKGIDTKSYWYRIDNTGEFAVIVPDDYVQGLEEAEKHFIADTKEETTAELRKKIVTENRDLLIRKDDDGEIVDERYRVMVRGHAIEEQNTMTAITASLCLYIAFILISAVGTILAVQSLSDAAKYKYRYLTLSRLGVNETSLYQTVRKQLFILFAFPFIISAMDSFCILVSVNNVYHTLLENGYVYLLYFAGSLLIFFLIYGIYWLAAYVGFKRNIGEES